MPDPSTHRCGTIAIIGRPNVGKSTLLNRFLGQKIAIVSPKPETTRDRLLGVLTLPDAQLLFFDTPGIYRGAKTLMAKHQIAAAQEALAEADIVLMLTEAQAGFLEEDRQIIQLLPKNRGQSPVETVPVPPVFLAINKVDRVKKDLILPQIDAARRAYPFQAIFPICAMKGDNVPELLGAIVQALPEEPALYPADQLTDRPMRTLGQELIREKVLLFTHEEVPHAVAVVVEEWREGQKPEGVRPLKEIKGSDPVSKTYIRAVIHVERESQKGILIGKGGSLLKRIGEAARRELEDWVGGPVFLDLWVKVAHNWRKDPTLLKRLGY